MSTNANQRILKPRVNKKYIESAFWFLFVVIARIVLPSYSMLCCQWNAYHVYNSIETYANGNTVTPLWQDTNYSSVSLTAVLIYVVLLHNDTELIKQLMLSSIQLLNAHVQNTVLVHLSIWS